MSTLKYSISSWKDTSTLDTVSLPGNKTLVESFAKQLAKWIGSYIANYFKTSRIKQLAYLPLTCARFILKAMSACTDDQLYNVYVSFTNKTEQYLLTFYTCYNSKHTFCNWFWNVTWNHQKTMLVWSTTPLFKTAFQYVSTKWRDVSELLFCRPNQQILKTSQQFAVVFMGRKTFLFWTRHQDIFQPRLWWENQVKWSFPNQNWVEFGPKPNQTVLSQQKVKNETYRKMKLQYNKCKDYVCGLQNHLIRWLLTFPWNIIWSFEYMMCPHTM